ncbi:MAG: C25 family cysteine peptidase [Candidatus Edwardsbacteria bacterium]
MEKTIVKAKSLFLTFLFCGSLFAGELRQTYGGQVKKEITFSSESLHFTTVNGYDVVTIPGHNLLRHLGEPQLPVKEIYLVIPQNARITGLEIIEAQTQEISEKYKIYPAQKAKPRYLEMQDPSLTLPHGGRDKEWGSLFPSGKDKKEGEVPPRTEVYNSSNIYPEKPIQIVGSGYFGGYQIVSLLFYPLQYFPSQQHLRVNSKIKFRLLYDLSSKSPERISHPIHRDILTSLVMNPEDINSLTLDTGWKPVLPKPGLPKPVLPKPVLPSDYPYLVITAAGYDTVFQRLTEWKQKKGIPAKIVTTDSIYTAYPGTDNAEKIRNFLKDAYTNWGMTYVLLGGDTDIIPARYAYIEFQSITENIPTDLYYAALDGTWDANNNGIYGELTDTVDLYPELFVGRASVNAIAKAQAFVNKILTYEKNPPTDYELKMAFFASMLDASSNSGIAKDMIDEDYVPGRFDPITKLYQANGNETPQTVISAMQTGQGVMNHDGHAGTTVMQAGTGYINSNDMDTLHNAPRFSILYSLGCWPAAFDYDCIAEHFVNNPNGGGTAFVGNSRYGFYIPGFPGYGSSELFDQRFFESLLCEDISNLSAVVVASKLPYIAEAQIENDFRWIEYSLNLLGDPEMPAWTDTPRSLTVDYPAVITPGLNQIKITVHDGLTPLENSLVCLMKGSEVYAKDYTSSTGEVNLSISPTTSGTVLLTVTAHNYLPHQGEIFVTDSLAQISYWRCEINDTAGGNGDGMVNPGETIQMPVILKNSGNKPAIKVTATLVTADSLVTILENQKDYGDILPGDSALSQGSYKFSVSSQTANAHTIQFNLQITDSLSNWWNGTISMVVATPILAYHQHSIQDSAGNNNGIAEPGDTIKIKVKVKNKGLGLAKGVVVGLATGDTNLTLIDTTATFGNILPDSVGNGEFRVYILPTSPSTHLAILPLNPQTNDGYSFTDSLRLIIGQTGFSDSCEDTTGWTHSGTQDLWHLTTSRYHSYNHSWYCGNDTDSLYPPNCTARLTTPSIILPANSTLSFWQYYILEAGWDYGIIEIGIDTTWKQLGLITGNSGGWTKSSYNLSNYFGSTEAKFRFTLFSDNDAYQYEGWYVDDIEVKSADTAVEEPLSAIRYPLSAFRLYQNYPNPFSSQTAIRYLLSAISHTTLKIYNVAGQLVKTLVGQTLVGQTFLSDITPGVYSVSWDGRDESGKRVASGVYFYQLTAGDFSAVKKMVLLR